jgi:uncharacterized membrane protein YkgB
MTIGYPTIPATPHRDHPTITSGLAHYAKLTELLHRYCLPALRIALGVVYVWFGALKLTSAPPVAQLVRESIPFVTAPHWLVPALGIFELAIGLCLIFRIAPLVVLPLFLGHLVGTFSVLVVQPGVAFEHGDPLLLSMTGEFVVKNLVLLAAGIVVCTSPRWDGLRSATRTDALAGRLDAR